MKKFLIWSNEHGAWWAPNGNGYVNFRDQAGRWSLEEAIEICEPSFRVPPNVPEETMSPDFEEGDSVKGQ